MVVGEPGIGKTRLMQEAARAGEARGFGVAWGRGWELGGAPAFWPWIEALRALARDRAGAAAVPRLGGESETDRFFLFDEVVTFLREGCRERPMLILLDDLHAADVG